MPSDFDVLSDLLHCIAGVVSTPHLQPLSPVRLLTLCDDEVEHGYPATPMIKIVIKST